MYTDFRHQFVDRSLKLLQSSKWLGYEASALLNFANGLIVFPKGKMTKQQWESKRAKELIGSFDFSSWTIRENGEPKHDVTFFYVLSRVRNALAHSYVEPFLTMEEEEVSYITFRDQYKNKQCGIKKDYEIVVSVQDLIIFAKKVAKVYLDYK